MIELCDIKKVYGQKEVIPGLSFTINKGESVALVGGSGSGKTTTLKMINRLIEPTEGKILINGEDTKKIPAHILRRKIGYVFQKIGLFPHMTIAQNIAVPMKLAGFSKKLIAKRIDELLAMVSLDKSLKNRKPRELSGGQQQRVGVARGLATSPELMLLDEPFGALDPIVREQIQQTFLELKKSLGLTAIFVTHDIAEAIILADRIAVMKNGQLLQMGTAQELIANPANEYVEQMLSAPKRQNQAYDELIMENL